MLGQEGAVALREEGLSGLRNLREIAQGLRFRDGTNDKSKVFLKKGEREGRRGRGGEGGEGGNGLEAF